MIKLIVTGGKGFVGKHLQHEIETFRGGNKNYDVMYLGSTARLQDRDLFEQICRSFKPHCVIHLAGRVGGITDNANNQKEFLETNLLINTNVIRTVDKLRIPTVSLSSSCCYPVYPQDRYPLKEDDFYIGNFEPTNYTYALAKACMMKQIELSDNQHVCLIPCNLIGKFDHYGSPKSHFVPAMITKLVQAQREGKKKITLLGDGNSCRQFCDAGDIAELIVDRVVKNREDWEDFGRFVNVGPQRQLSIKDAAEIIRNQFAPDIEIEFDGDPKYNGIRRKDINDAKLQSYFGRIEDPHRPGSGAGYEYEYTTFEESIKIIANDKNIVIP